MGAYLFHRFRTAIPVLLIITVLNFIFINAAPGDPALMLLPPNLEAEAGVDRETLIRANRERLGLDQPLPVRYVKWLREVLTGNLGRSMLNGEGVSAKIGKRVVPTLKLMAFALFLQIFVGVSVGIISAVRRNSWVDYLSTVTSFIAVSVPNFFLGLIFVYVFALRLKWFPTSGIARAHTDNPLSDLLFIILPGLVLGLSGAASLVRYTRSSMLEVLRLEYVTTARSKGLSERIVVMRHAFRNGLLPIITVISLSLPTLLGGAVIVERIFFWPGLGTLAMESVTGRDYPVLMALNLLISIAVMVSNLLADVAYALVDPRIRYR